MTSFYSFQLFSILTDLMTSLDEYSNLVGVFSVMENISFLLVSFILSCYILLTSLVFQNTQIIFLLSIVIVPFGGMGSTGVMVKELRH
jgi:hypothetical protein